MAEYRNMNKPDCIQGQIIIPALYVVTDTVIGRGRSHAEIASRAAAGGAGIIQLRDKMLSPATLLREAIAIREAMTGYDALFVVNDSLAVALASGADGVHLGQSDGSVTEARAAAEAAFDSSCSVPGAPDGNGPERFIIGVSIGSVEEACLAVEEGADYVALSPVFSTGSKADAGAGHGLALLQEIREAVPGMPLVGIGGIGPHNVQDVFRAGADSVAVISAVVGQDDVTAAARAMMGLIGAVKGR